MTATPLSARRVSSLARRVVPAARYSTKTGNGGFLLTITESARNLSDIEVLNIVRDTLRGEGYEATVVRVGHLYSGSTYILKVTEKVIAAAEEVGSRPRPTTPNTLSAVEEDARTAEMTPAEEPGYPVLTTDEAVAINDAGLNLYAPQGGSYSYEVREGGPLGGRLLGRVRAVTEHLGEGFWLHYAAYRTDGSRVGYAPTRLRAALLLRS